MMIIFFSLTFHQLLSSYINFPSLIERLLSSSDLHCDVVQYPPAAQKLPETCYSLTFVISQWNKGATTTTCGERSNERSTNQQLEIDLYLCTTDQLVSLKSERTSLYASRTPSRSMLVASVWKAEKEKKIKKTMSSSSSSSTRMMTMA